MEKDHRETSGEAVDEHWRGGLPGGEGRGGGGGAMSPAYDGLLSSGAVFLWLSFGVFGMTLLRLVESVGGRGIVHVQKPNTAAIT